MKEDLGGEFAGLEARLRGADLAADSRVRNALKARLLAARRPGRRVPELAWLLPAFAAAALFFMFCPRKAAEAPGYGYSYGLPDDGYAACGRRGLEDFGAGERF